MLPRLLERLDGGERLKWVTLTKRDFGSISTCYQSYDCEHFLCNAHHLRELQYVLEHTGQWWAFHLSGLLVSIHSQVKALKAQRKTTLPDEDIAALTARYDAILDQGLKQNPMPLPDPTKLKKQGRPKRSASRNLLERLQTHKAAVLGFMHNFDVPFDNNQAERDLRMMMLKLKISGCFRSDGEYAAHG